MVKRSIDSLNLGLTWHSDHNCHNPTLNEIFYGLLVEVTRQIELGMANMDKFLVLEAKANLKETWEDLFSLADVQDRDKILT